MPNPNALYEDMEKLNALYEELCWAHDDELVFTHENGRVIIKNKTLEEQQWKNCLPLRQRSSTHVWQWLVLLLLLVLTSLLVKSFLEYGDGIDSSCSNSFGNICRCCFPDKTWWRMIPNCITMIQNWYIICTLMEDLWTSPRLHFF